MDTEPESIIRCVKTSAVVRHVVVEPGCRAVTSHEASLLRARTVTPVTALAPVFLTVHTAERLPPA